ncbi:PREDICTED: RNA-binding protein 25-like [Diuraphis noxia]|uniref:RNA-binding protein 25-like n=1 Tax=Diuraphis noxia TaxID=143948 RepID=UPI0007635FC2|nr:PREDICTED: RNA-binding protein 25-like [Diuraphis noxia]
MPRRPLTDEQREQSRKRRLERDRERQRKRRLDPELRAIERGKNTIAKRLSRSKVLNGDNINKLYSEANIDCSRMTSMLDNEDIIGLKDLNRLKKERDKERQRQRRMDPEFRAKERARNRILKRIARQKSYYTLEVVNCECCGEPIESDHVCFSNILSVELHEIDISHSTIKKL